MTVPSTVTIRSRKRTIGSTASAGTGTGAGAGAGADETTPTNTHHANPDLRKHAPAPTRASTSPGLVRLASRASRSDRCPIAILAGWTRSPPARAAERASRAMRARRGRTDSHAAGSGITPPPRPMSRTSLGGARTPLGRPRSSLGGSMHGHGHSQSVSYSTAEVDELRDIDGDLRTPSRRGTYSRLELEGASGASGIPLPSSSRRQSGGPASGRRSSAGPASGGQAGKATNKLADVGETY